MSFTTEVLKKMQVLDENFILGSNSDSFPSTEIGDNLFYECLNLNF